MPKQSPKGTARPKTMVQPKTKSAAKSSGAALNGRGTSQPSKAAKAEEQKKEALASEQGKDAAPEGENDEEKQEWGKAEHTVWARQTYQPALAEFLDYWAHGVPNPPPDEDLIAEGVTVTNIEPLPVPDASTDVAYIPWVAWEDPWFEESDDDEEEKGQKGTDKKEEKNDEKKATTPPKEKKDKEAKKEVKEENKEEKKDKKTEKREEKKEVKGEEKEESKDKKEKQGKEEKKKKDEASTGKDDKEKKKHTAARGGAIVYSPPMPRKDVCIMWIHGGSFQWQRPDEESYTYGCSRVAAATGMTVVMPDHLLSGEGRAFIAPTILWQLIANLIWLTKNDPVTCKKRDVDCAVILAGDSSGGTQAVSILLLLARDAPDVLRAIPCLALMSPAFDLTCRCHTYISNAYADDHRTGDAFFTDGVEVNRNIYRGIGMAYVGSEEGLTDCIYSPYWLARWPNEELLAVLDGYRIPIWMCVGAPEALCGEVLDFAQRLRGRLPMEVWLHEGMFHCWVLMRSCHPFYSRDVAVYNMVEFIHRVVGVEPAAWPEQPELKEGIHYYVDEWY